MRRTSQAADRNAFGTYKDDRGAHRGVRRRPRARKDHSAAYGDDRAHPGDESAAYGDDRAHLGDESAAYGDDRAHLEVKSAAYGDDRADPGTNLGSGLCIVMYMATATMPRDITLITQQ